MAKKKFISMSKVEIVVTCLIILVLAGLILPVKISGPHPGPKVYCTNNLRQLYSAMMVYAEDNKGNLPWAGSGKQPHDHLQLLVDGGYITEPELFRCPADKSNPGIPASAVNARGWFKLTAMTCSYTMYSKPQSLFNVMTVVNPPKTIHEYTDYILCDKNPEIAHNGEGLLLLKTRGSVKFKKWEPHEKKVLPEGMYDYRSEK